MIEHTVTTHVAGPILPRQALVAYRLVSPLCGIRITNVECRPGQTGLVAILPAGARLRQASCVEATAMIHIEWRGEGYLVFQQDLLVKAEEE